MNNNNTYEHYKKARDMAWSVLIDCGINKLPVNLNDIAKKYDIDIILYSQSNLISAFKKEIVTGDGFTSTINNKKVIFLNDRIKNKDRRRFTVAHELGHILLGHNINKYIQARNMEIDSTIDMNELEANVFARNILMPACVLKELDVTTVDEIMEVCKISKQSAIVRLRRLEELKKRDMFYMHHLEKNVIKQFEEFIFNKKNNFK